MAESGLLLHEKARNQVFYQANAECLIYEKPAAIFRKTMGLTSLLENALSDFGDRVAVAFVFGSMASGRHCQALTSSISSSVIVEIVAVETLIPYSSS